MQRLTRIRPNKPLTYGNYVFDAKTPLAMDVWHMHTNETLFPEPMRFNPDRWLGQPTVDAGADPLVPGGVKPQKTRPLSHFMRAFSSGTRGCFGGKFFASCFPYLQASSIPIPRFHSALYRSPLYYRSSQ